jgi:hypothetical protein
MDKHFDTLYFYILTEKQPKYSDDKIKDSLLRGFNFDQKEHIIGKNKLLECINEITDTPKLELLAKLFEHEFSDAQIEIRKSEFEKGYLNNEPEELFPNMLPITFPENF